jgi:hypothetical protein
MFNFEFMRRLNLLFVLVFIGCQLKAPDAAVHISLINQQQTLQITGIDPVIMQDINRDTAANWQALFPIYRMPADTGMKNYQPMQPGNYQLKGSVLLFTPDTAFTPQQTYFMRYYNYGSNKSIWDYVKGKAKINQTRFADLIF